MQSDEKLFQQKELDHFARVLYPLSEECIQYCIKIKCLHDGKPDVAFQEVLAYKP